jgi:NhaA family Na+:H+ antiporter
VVGKQLGITLAAAAVVRLGLAALPTGVGWRHIYGAAWLGGVGFTMSLFIGTLAFGDGSGELALAKLGILASSIIVGVGGYAILFRTSAERRKDSSCPPTARSRGGQLK